MQVNLPNSLTLARIFIVPFLVVVLLTNFAEDWFGVQRYFLAIVLFVTAAVTDILDGHLARKRNQVSKLGILLDPVADKLLVMAALIALVENHLAPAWATVIILGREFAVTGLRSIAASDGLMISASRAGKIKMWAQCIAIVSLMIAGTSGQPAVSNFGQPFPLIKFWTVPEVQTAFASLFKFTLTANEFRVIAYTVGRGMLWVAVISAIWSMYGYFEAFYKENKRRRIAETLAMSETA